MLKLDQCPGHPDKHFIGMVSSKQGTCKERNGKDIIAVVDRYAPVALNGEVYDATVRNSQCEIIVNGAKCEKCVSYRDTLRKAYHRWIKSKQTSASRRTSSTSKANFRYLDTPEKQQRSKKLKRRSRETERKLRDAIEWLTQEKGVSMEPDMQNDLQSIMDEKTAEVRNIQKTPFSVFSGSSN